MKPGPGAGMGQGYGGGRPLLFTDPDVLQEQIDAYFDRCDEGQTIEEITKRGDVVSVKRAIPYTMEGLALALKCSSESLRNYGKAEKFFGIISCARDRIKENWVRMGLSGQYNPKMAALCLAAHNKEYRVTQEVNHVSSTVEGILQRLSGQQAAPQIEHAGDDISDAEVIE